jgi:DNA repair protein RecN (Recombination protein N)
LSAPPTRLLRLDIEDFGLIERAAVAFGDGFTACTGETGSGKTMLLGALAFVLGERTAADVVRRGAARARVTLEIEADDALRAHFAEEGCELDAGEAAVVMREVGVSGKTAARLNGRPATAAQLRALGDALVDRIGQYEHQRLLQGGYQLETLDRFAGPAAAAAREAVAALHAETAQLEREGADLSERAGRALAELEFARYAAAEIDAAALVAGEDEALRERREYLANVERIAAALGAAHDALAGAERGALEALGSGAGALAAVARFAPQLAGLAAALGALQSDAGEAAAALARELENTELDAAELDAASARLDAIERLKKKYGATLEAIAAARAEFGASVERVETREERSRAIDAQLAASRERLAAAGETLRRLRVKAARDLERRVAAELAGLAMPAARFAALVEPLPAIGPAGGDRVEFALSPNAGEPLRPLAKAASGGELSRVLLALAVVLAGRRERTALIFDEIDAGIGGAAAGAVGVRLGALARTAQIVCVTHLAQIAAWADVHYALRKRSRKGATLIDIVQLEEPRAVREEIARMLSGSAAGVALEHAATLLREAQAARAKLTA